jgi:hypothetical protein
MTRGALLARALHRRRATAKEEVIMERLENVLARQRQNLIVDILLAVVLIIALGIAALSLGARSSATPGADNAADNDNIPQLVHASNQADATSVL